MRFICAHNSGLQKNGYHQIKNHIKSPRLRIISPSIDDWQRKENRICPDKYQNVVAYSVIYIVQCFCTLEFFSDVLFSFCLHIITVAPLLRNQQEEYRKLQTELKELTSCYQCTAKKLEEAQLQKRESERRAGFYRRETSRLKQTCSDLSKQVSR